MVSFAADEIFNAASKDRNFEKKLFKNFVRL